MAAIQTKPVDDILADVANYIFGKYKYLQIGTGTAQIADNQTAIVGSTKIGITADLFNKLRMTATEDSFVSGNAIVNKFAIETGEPFVQPVNIGQMGIMSQQTAGGGLGMGAKMSVAATKDNQSKWISRVELRIRRLS
jgi:hypothetical protein